MLRQPAGHPNLPWYRAIGTMIGSVVGVGVFGLPYAFAQSGYVVGLLELFFVSGFLLVLQLMYAEIAIQTPGNHRIVGYIKQYLGHPWDRVTAVLFAVYTWGAMIAYMIVGGGFFHILLSPLLGGSEFWYQLSLAVVVAWLTFRGIRYLAKMELVIVCALLFLFVFMSLAALPHVHVPNLSLFHPEKWFLPYGVVLFALSGLGVVPEMKDVLGKQMMKLPYAVVAGQVIVTLLYAIFTFAVVGVTGEGTVENAFQGLVPILGSTFMIVGSLLGVLTVASIFSLLSIELQGTLRFDYHWSLRKAWGVVMTVPILCFLFGVREFIDLIGFLGAVFGGVLGILLIAAYERMRHSPVCINHRCLNVPHAVSWGLVLILASGMLYTIFQVLFPHF
jgi:amino acid permease